MPRVFSKQDNPYWPLPADYPTLGDKGQRMARRNAVKIRGTPELEVASWHFFRSYYLFPTPTGMWYKGGVKPSPLSHYEWVRDWADHRLCLHVTPRGSSKSTIVDENILKKIISRDYWETLLFLSTQSFVTSRLSRFIDQIERNERIIEDFGRLKPKRNEGIWNRGSQIQLTNGSKIIGMPIKGASLGNRPSGEIILDDVEKADDLVIEPTDLREAFESFFFNAIYPMAEEGVGIKIIGTCYHRRMFIYWLHTTDDERLEFWHRRLLDVVSLNWQERMGDEWQARQKQIMGVSRFNAQYMNDPGTASDRLLQVDPALCTYWLENSDREAYEQPFQSQATVVTHGLKGWKEDTLFGEQVPVPVRIERPWSNVVANMRRFITVDSAKTTTETSDFSVVHCMGFENSKAHRDTLWSLDCWMGKVRYEEIVKQIYKMAVKWQVNLIGVEDYAVYQEFFEMARDLLPSLYGKAETPPRLMPIKFPTKYDKASKIAQMEWRFNQFRIKLPVDRKALNPAYTRLFYEIENFTEDLALLDHDDVLDTLSMHQAIGKPHKAIRADVIQGVNLVEKMLDGEVEECGIPLMSGINASDLTPDQLNELMHRRYDEAGYEDEDEELAGLEAYFSQIHRR